jgi:hypothetical protein
LRERQRQTERGRKRNRQRDQDKEKERDQHYERVSKKNIYLLGREKLKYPCWAEKKNFQGICN